MKNIINNKILKKSIVSILLLSIILNVLIPIKVVAAQDSLYDEDITFTSEYVPKSNGLLPYAEYIPSGIKESESIPLIVWLHDGGRYSQGYDGGTQKQFLKYPGMPADYTSDYFTYTLHGFKAYMIAPQLSGNQNDYEGSWCNEKIKDKLKNTIDDFVSKHNVDKQRIIISGYSIGGEGTVYMAYHIPNFFSKAVVIDATVDRIEGNFDKISIPVRGYVSNNESETGKGFMYNMAEKVPNAELIQLDVNHGMASIETFKIDEKGIKGVPDVIEWMLGEETESKGSSKFFDEDITFDWEYPSEYVGMPYGIYAPSSAEKSDSIPMIVFLHGSGEVGSSGEKLHTQSSFSIWENWGLEGFNAYILCPHLTGDTWSAVKGWDNAASKQGLKELLDYIIKEYNIDTDYIVISGASLGGYGSIYMARELPEYFSKLVTISGYQISCEGIDIPTRGYVGTRDWSDPLGGEDPKCISFMNGDFANTFGEENVFNVEDAGHNDVVKKAFYLDENNNERSDLIEWMFDDYCDDDSSGGINDFTFEDIISPDTGLDTYAGILMEPTVWFFQFVIDSFVSIVSSFMVQEGFEPVMVQSIEDITTDLGEPTTTFTINEEELDEYRTVSGALDLEYPNFKYSSEEVFNGNFPFLNANFIKESDHDVSSEGNQKIVSQWEDIRSVVSQWYQVLRMVAIIGLLSVLIYTGIKIILSSNAKEKAKYKEMIYNWIIAVALVFVMHYIMGFIFAVTEEITELISSIAGVIEVKLATGESFKTNLIGLARFQMQQQHFSAKIGHLVIYIALITYTIKFTIVYLKRVIRMAFLTLIAPIVALTYPIDKMNGQAKGFNTWLKDYMFNAILQPVHYILYYLLVSTSLSLAVNNPLYAIAALAFISQAERLLKNIFGFEKADAGSVGGIAGAFATGAVTGALTNYIRDPLHPFSGKNKKGKSGSSGGNSGNDYNYDDNDLELIDAQNDTANFDSFIGADIRGGSTSRYSSDDEDDDFASPGSGRSGSSGSSRGTDSGEDPTLSNVDNSIYRARQEVSGNSIDELGGLSFNDGDNKGMKALLDMIASKQGKLKYGDNSPKEIEKLNSQVSGLEAQLENRVRENEALFNGNWQYADNDKRTTSQLLKEIKRLNLAAQDPNISPEKRQELLTKSSKLLKKVKRRMAENQYLEKRFGKEELKKMAGRKEQQKPNGTEQNPNQKEEEKDKEKKKASEKGREQPNNKQEEKKKKYKDSRTAKRIRGVKNVAKTAIKPVWYPGKDPGENTKRLVGKIIKGSAGLAVGIGAAAVQAGISITDGNYNPVEGIGTVGASVFAASRMGQGRNGIVEAYKEGSYQGENVQTVEEYGRKWYNREDVIEHYNREFPGQGKVMRQRVVNNYITRGITDKEDQVMALRFAEQLKSEKGMNEKEADKIAIATMQYKQSLGGNYRVLWDKDKRKKYLDQRVKEYGGSASSDSVRQLHDDFLENVLDFDRANR